MLSAQAKDPLSARKMPSQRRSAITVATIVEAGARILKTSGLTGYNCNDIARLAGISVGSLYQYFPNKDAITSALIHREMSAMLAAASGISRSTPAADQLQCLVEIAVDFQFRRPGLARLLDVEEERLPVTENLAALRAELMGVVRPIICDLVGVAEDPNYAAEDVVAVIRGLVDSAARRGETDTDAITARVARAVIGYLGQSVVR